MNLLFSKLFLNSSPLIKIYGENMQLITPEDWKEIYSANGSTGLVVLSNDKIEIVRLNIGPNGIIGEHRLPFPVTFYILEGSPTLMIDGKEIKLSKDNSIHCTPEINRGWKNESDKEVKILVIKTLI